MSKFGWSYPPGVSEKDLSGNSKEEQEQEALVESIYEALSPFRKFYDSEGGEGDLIEDQVAAVVEVLVSEAYAKGRADALADEGLVRELQPDIFQIFLDEKNLRIQFNEWLAVQPLRS